MEKSLAEQFKIAKTNAHERLYQNDKNYRALGVRLDELDARNQKEFPDAYRSHKDFRKEISKERRKLHENDPAYKELLFATHRANRAIEAFLIEQKPEIENWPRSRKEAEVERLRRRFEKDERYPRLVASAEAAQAKLEAAYPRIFVSDEEIKAMKKAANEAAKNDPEFKKAKAERAAAYRAQQEYLLKHDKRLAELTERLEKDSR